MEKNDMDLEFLDELKKDLDNDIEDIKEDSDNIKFDIDEEEEEDLDLDLNDLINKIDAKIEEINDSSNDQPIDNKDEIKEIKINSIDQDDDIDQDKDESETIKQDSIKDDDELDLMDISIPETKGDTKSDLDSSFIKFDSLEQPKEEDLNLSPIIDDNAYEIEDDLNKIQEDVEDEINTIANDKLETDLNSLFVKVNSNVKEASDIFLKNVEMKKKIDKRFDELKELQQEIEKAKQNDYTEINNYKDNVLKELLEKKEEIEKRLNELKDLQANFEKEKSEFEKYKREAKADIDDYERQQKVKDDSRKEELEKLEDKLRLQKDALDEERRQLSLDRIQYETDKNELANNMLKFNEIVGTFTDGVGNLNN